MSGEQEYKYKREIWVPIINCCQAKHFNSKSPRTEVGPQGGNSSVSYWK